MNRKVNILVDELCEEIDYWKFEANKWKEKYEEQVRENSSFINERLEDSKKMLGNALMFALSVREGEDGSLVIPAENRQGLADRYRTEQTITI